MKKRLYGRTRGTGQSFRPTDDQEPTPIWEQQLRSPKAPLMVNRRLSLISSLMCISAAALTMWLLWWMWQANDFMLLVLPVIFGVGSLLTGVQAYLALHPRAVRGLEFPRRLHITRRAIEPGPQLAPTAGDSSQPGQHLAVRLASFAGDTRQQDQHALITMGVTALPFTVIPLIGKVLTGSWWFAPYPFLILIGMVWVSQARRLVRVRGMPGIDTIVEIGSAVVERGDDVALYVEQRGDVTVRLLTVAIVCETLTLEESRYRSTNHSNESYRLELATELDLRLTPTRPWQTSLTMAIPANAPLTSTLATSDARVEWSIVVMLYQSDELGVDPIERRFPITVAASQH